MQSKCRFLVRIFAVFLAVAASAVFFTGCDDGSRDSTIFFERNGGTGPLPDPIIRSAGSSITLPDPVGLTKTGHAFGGWNTRADGEGTNHNAGVVIPMPSGNITMYAMWDITAISITVTGIPLDQYTGLTGFVVLETEDLQWVAASGFYTVTDSSMTFAIYCGDNLPFAEPGPHIVFLAFEDASGERVSGYDIWRNVTEGMNTIPIGSFTPAVSVVVTGIPAIYHGFTAVGEFLDSVTRLGQGTSESGWVEFGGSVVLHFIGIRPRDYYVVLWMGENPENPWELRYETAIRSIGAMQNIIPFAAFTGGAVVGPTPNITWNATPTGTPTTTAINFTFSSNPGDLIAEDFTIAPGTGSATVGALSGTGTTRTLTVSNVSAGTVSVYIYDFYSSGIVPGPQTVTLIAAAPATNITWNASPTGTPTTTAINFTFSGAPAGLVESDITITAGTGAATRGTLSGTGTTRTLTVSNVSAGTVSVSINRAGIASGPQTVTLLAPPPPQADILVPINIDEFVGLASAGDAQFTLGTTHGGEFVELRMTHRSADWHALDIRFPALIAAGYLTSTGTYTVRVTGRGGNPAAGVFMIQGIEPGHNWGATVPLATNAPFAHSRDFTMQTGASPWTGGRFAGARLTTDTAGANANIIFTNVEIVRVAGGAVVWSLADTLTGGASSPTQPITITVTGIPPQYHGRWGDLGLWLPGTETEVTFSEVLITGATANFTLNAAPRVYDLILILNDALGPVAYGRTSINITAGINTMSYATFNFIMFLSADIEPLGRGPQDSSRASERDVQQTVHPERILGRTLPDRLRTRMRQ